MSLFVAVDVEGPVGVFGSAEEARAALAPYIAKCWRGLLCAYSPAGDKAPAPGDDVLLLMPRACGASTPYAVGLPDAVRELQRSLDDSGMVESAEDLEFHLTSVGSVIPLAKLRLDPLIETPETTNAHGLAIAKFLQTMQEDLQCEGESEERTLARRLPLLGEMFSVEACAEDGGQKSGSRGSPPGEPYSDAASEAPSPSEEAAESCLEPDCSADGESPSE